MDQKMRHAWWMDAQPPKQKKEARDEAVALPSNGICTFRHVEG
jgi:hypothetical protein